jgi:RNA polymerase sigma factor (sigma-70 family)
MAGFADCRPDTAMLERARRGDMKAHEVLYGAMAARSTPSPCGSSRMRPLAEEVLQDTSIEVIRHIREFRDDAAFGGWVKRIATNKCLAYLRSAWHRKSPGFQEDEDESEGPSWEPEEGEDFGGAAGGPGEPGAALARLTPTARTVVWLYDVEGYSHQEIAALMGKTVSFSKSRLARAHEQLRARLGPDYQEASTCMPLPNNC